MPDERVRRHAPRRLLERLARRGLRQRFARLEMTCGLIELAARARLLLDEQELPVALDDGGDRDGRPETTRSLMVLRPHKRKGQGDPLPFYC